MIKRSLLFTTVLALWGVGVQAEMWCGHGPQTPLDHPCGAAPRAAVAAAVLQYRDEWMGLVGVGNVESVTSQNRNEEILVHVDRYFEESARSRIPPSVDGVPVVIVPGFPPRPDVGVIIEVRPMSAADAALVRSDREQGEASEKSRLLAVQTYSAAVQRYRKHWLALPGVLGIGPAKCTGDGCDFGSVGIMVQRQLLDVARSEIPNSAVGVPVVLIPQD